MLINTDKYYCLAYTEKETGLARMNKYQIWNNLSTAVKNLKTHKSISHWKDLKILEIDVCNPGKSRFVEIRGEESC